ncbi:bax inhibitor 1-like [Ruditapes philippinarum]|uniref:bax inhibitor 1-like n=1 Tax=Ruditapes philippinarum TaxID=129788 RepID=UPI00295AC7B4|nr:bax inhibitor 1-like [Ruditapes philippinarum]
MASTAGFLPQEVFKFDHLETRVQKHLKKVYGTLSISMFAAAAGAYVHLFTGLMSAGLLTALGSIGLMIWLAATSHTKENEQKRLGIFIGFTFLSGVSLGPLLDMVIRIDPSIITTALLGTCLIFISFSLAALYNTNRTYLYLGGMLLSALSWMCMLSLMNIFFQSKMIYDLNLYGGLVIFCGFVLYDTQLIIEKARRGDDDYIWQSVDLFIDFIQIFRRLLIILASKEDSKKKRKD